MSKRPISRYVRFASLFAALGAAALAVSVSTPPAAADHAWNGYHWARTSAQQSDDGGFNLKVLDYLTSAWDDLLAIKLTDWSASSVLDLVRDPTSPASPALKDRKQCKAVLGKVKDCDADYGFLGWLGLAQIWVYSDGHIAQGVAKMNNSYLNRPPYNTLAWRLLVLCQENGHVLGLGHVDENFDNPNLGTCMDYTSDPDGPPSNEHPNQHDYDQLASIYSHLDSTTTVGASINSALASVPFVELRAAAVMAGNHDEDLNDPSQWGRLVRESRDGRLAVYERNLGGGQRLLTRVIWAEPRGR